MRIISIFIVEVGREICGSLSHKVKNVLPKQLLFLARGFQDAKDLRINYGIFLLLCFAKRKSFHVVALARQTGVSIAINLRASLVKSSQYPCYFKAQLNEDILTCRLYFGAQITALCVPSSFLKT